MKTPRLATAMLAAAAMMGGTVIECEPVIDYRNQSRIGFHPSKRRRNKTSAINQRQIRKNRRRAFAAGNRKAFA
jgi:hypothetical protein